MDPAQIRGPGLHMPKLGVIHEFTVSPPVKPMIQGSIWEIPDSHI